MDNSFSKLYAFATENIAGYINQFDLKDKSLLTVGSSTDQLINANLFDSKKVTLLDISPNTEKYYYLKLSSLLTLSLEEYLKFLCPTYYPKFYRKNPELYNIEVYNKIKDTLKSLDKDSYTFWEQIFNTMKPTEILNNYIIQDISNSINIERCNPYLSNTILYTETKNKILKSDNKFIISDLNKIELSDSFDNIWLSNIIDWLGDTKEYTNTVNNLITNNLNNNGKILITYLYKVKDNIEREYYDEKKLLKNLIITPEVTQFESMDNKIYTKDAILTYKKH